MERVRYALGALKGVGEKAMEALVEEQEGGSPFTSLEDFAERIDRGCSIAGRSKASPRRARWTGSSPSGRRSTPPRKHPRSCLERAGTARRAARLAFSAGNSAEVAPIRLRRTRMADRQRMAAEREAFGFYFSAHPVISAGIFSPRTRPSHSPRSLEIRGRRGRRAARPWRAG